MEGELVQGQSHFIHTALVLSGFVYIGDFSRISKAVVEY